MNYNEFIIPDGFDSLGNGLIKHRRRNDVLKWFSIRDYREALKYLPEGVQVHEYGIPYRGEHFNVHSYHHDPKEDARLIQSLKKYGGVYLPKYPVSKGEDGLPHFIPNEEAWTEISFEEATKVSVQYGTQHLKGKIIHTGVLPGWLFDAVCIYEIAQGNRTWEEMAEEQLAGTIHEKPLEFGWLDGNIRIWTREKYGACRVIRMKNYPMTPKSKYLASIVARNPMFTSETNPMLSFQMYVACI